MERAENSRSHNAHVINIEGSGVPHGSRAHNYVPSATQEILIDMIFKVMQIIAAVVILSVSKHEKPQKPLFVWVVGYMTGCVAILPSLYLLYRRHRNQVTPSSTSEKSYFVDDFPILVGCFFGVWFVLGCVWLRHTSSSDAPNLYWSCVAFLAICGIWLATPIVKDYREQCIKSRGASEVSINALSGGGSNAVAGGVVRVGEESRNVLPGGCSNVVPGGVVGLAISGEDEVCCICLEKYVDRVALRVLPCSHFFHKECVDEWLEINSSCPLCKYELGSRYHL